MQVNQGFGCKKGGMFDCPAPSKILCKDGTQLDSSSTLKWRAGTANERRRLGDEYKGCACPDGVMPRFVKVRVA